VTVERFDAGGWFDSPWSRRRLDLGASAEARSLVQEIVARVRQEGDSALFEYSRRFDGWAPGPGEPLELGRPEMEAAWDRLSPHRRAALELAQRRIEEFHSTQLGPEVSGLPGLKLITRPVDRVGLYIPGGRAAYPSSVLMTAVPARVAGVGEISLATPPAADGSVPIPVLAAAHLAGVDRIYRMGGAQAISALAYGTASVRPVDLIAGPGNLYVTLAKREVFGAVGIDGIAGPTEIMVVADAGARPDLIAADLASQMEHDPLAWAVLVTDSAGLIDAVDEALEDLTPRLERAEVVRGARCCLILAGSMDEAMRISNEFAPEHLEIIAADSDRLARLADNAGAIFLGPWAPVSLGDYVIGPNHTLPTAGAARFGSPLGVYTFMKRSSLASLTEGDFGMLAEAAATLAEMEGLGAHAGALRAREVDSKGGRPG